VGHYHADSGRPGHTNGTVSRSEADELARFVLAEATKLVPGTTVELCVCVSWPTAVDKEATKVGHEIK